MTGQINIKY